MLVILERVLNVFLSSLVSQALLPSLTFQFLLPVPSCFYKAGTDMYYGGVFGVSSNLALSLCKNRILIFNNNDTSWKFGSSSTFEFFPWGEKKNTTRFFFLCCSEKLRA